MHVAMQPLRNVTERAQLTPTIIQINDCISDRYDNYELTSLNHDSLKACKAK